MKKSLLVFMVGLIVMLWMNCGAAEAGRRYHTFPAITSGMVVSDVLPLEGYTTVCGHWKATAPARVTVVFYDDLGQSTSADVFVPAGEWGLQVEEWVPVWASSVQVYIWVEGRCIERPLIYLSGVDREWSWR